VPLADSMAPGSDDKKALDAPSASLSKGGGVIRGIGEKFAANPVTGNGSLYSRRDEPRTLRIRTRAFMVVRFRLRNGPFGFGWSLALPAITRKTDKGLPRYRDAEESAPGTPPTLHVQRSRQHHGDTASHVDGVGLQGRLSQHGGERLDVPSDDPYARARLSGPGGT